MEKFKESWYSFSFKCLIEFRSESIRSFFGRLYCCLISLLVIDVFSLLVYSWFTFWWYVSRNLFISSHFSISFTYRFSK
jgi:hypothetical protein